MARVSVPTTPDTEIKTLRTQVAETDRRGAAAGVSLATQDQRLTDLEAASTSGQHAWTGANGQVNSGADIAVGGWSATSRAAGIATLSGSSLLLNRVGRWALTLTMDSDCSAAGILNLYLNWPGGAWTPAIAADNLINTQYRGSGFTGAGKLRTIVHWSGWVDDAAAGAMITPRVGWTGQTAVAASVPSYALLVDYLGS